MRIFGRNTVIERLRANPTTIRKIFLGQGFHDAGYIYKKAKDRNIPVMPVTSSKLIKIARNLNTQGILAEVDDFLYLRYDDLLDLARDKRHTLLFLDNLTDPQNLGAIIRTAATIGKFCIVLPTHDSVEVTESVLRVASGGDNYVPVAKVANLVNAIRSAKEAGFTVVGAIVKDGEKLNDVSFSFPLGVVVGSEQKGIRDVVRKQLDQEITIPMNHDTLSLNVAHATTILCYEIFRQKNAQKK